MRILVMYPLREDQKAQLKREFPQMEFIFDTNPSRSEVEGCEVFYGKPDFDIVENPPSGLKWVQLWMAGYDRYKVISKDLLVTHASGCYDQSVSEHALALAFALSHHIPSYVKNQERSQWKDEGQVVGFEESNVLVLGLGNIGRTVAKKFSLLGAHVYGIRRHIAPVEYVQEVHTMDDLCGLLGNMDYVVSCLPGGEGTKGVLDAKAFASCKPSALVINVGRGNAVDMDALYAALVKGQIAGYAGDAWNEEPLPSASPFWKLDNCLVTPHVAGGTHLEATRQRNLDIFKDNLKRYLKGEELHNLVRH